MATEPSTCRPARRYQKTFRASDLTVDKVNEFLKILNRMTVIQNTQKTMVLIQKSKAVPLHSMVALGGEEV
jgi:hypothetical protein